ncbi:MAG: twin-arginine translocase TatA/TatE family subunit, partial [Nitrospirota bacterium]|nr:twin-arginine translocase TatA/TatE family subunit [Nitrospirota bacterium]
LVFGPKRLPELGRTIGKGMAELKKAMYGIKEQMDSELHDIKDPMSHLDVPGKTEKESTTAKDSNPVRDKSLSGAKEKADGS